MLKVKGLDINDNDDFAGDRNFELRPSVNKDKVKKKKCCWKSNISHLVGRP